MRVILVWATIGMLGGSALAQTQTSSSAASVPRALAMAEAAFEYRDFEAVIATLDPWVHPPRIQDPVAMVRARRLLGVSRHITGDERGAREEFAQLLLLDPEQRLDPFVIPPRVIVTFEDVRRQMAPQLVPRPRPEPPDPLEAPPRIVAAPLPKVVALLPFGLNHVAADRSDLGIGMGTAQVVGLAASIVGFVMAGEARAEHRAAWPPSSPEAQSSADAYRGWIITQYAGAALFGLAYGTSVVTHLVEARDAGTPPRPSAPAETQVQLTLPF